MAPEDPSQIEWVPWSELGPEWIELWGGAPQPEHVEITGQTGSGKTYFLETILQQRAEVFNDREILIVTKKADEIFERLGWPVVDSFEDVRAYRQVVFWPQTDLQGDERDAYMEKKIHELLAKLWVKDSNCVVAFDEIGYVQGLSKTMKKLIGMWWREARSMGITIVAMKQRPVWVLRDQHSETRWKVVFPPADRGDMARFAELLGRRKDWEPILDELDDREFVLHHSARRSDIVVQSYVSWIDTPLRPKKSQQEQERQPALSTYRKEPSRGKRR